MKLPSMMQALIAQSSPAFAAVHFSSEVSPSISASKPVNWLYSMSQGMQTSPAFSASIEAHL